VGGLGRHLDATHDDGNQVVLDLLTCSGGEVMATLRSDDPW
jgi:hypothetical protein